MLYVQPYRYESRITYLLSLLFNFLITPSLLSVCLSPQSSFESRHPLHSPLRPSPLSLLPAATWSVRSDGGPARSGHPTYRSGGGGGRSVQHRCGTGDGTRRWSSSARGGGSTGPLDLPTAATTASKRGVRSLPAASKPGSAVATTPSRRALTHGTQVAGLNSGVPCPRRRGAPETCAAEPLAIDPLRCEHRSAFLRVSSLLPCSRSLGSVVGHHFRCTHRGGSARGAGGSGGEDGKEERDGGERVVWSRPLRRVCR
jgi:hypothetical protein